MAKDRVDGFMTGVTASKSLHVLALPFQRQVECLARTEGLPTLP